MGQWEELGEKMQPRKDITAENVFQNLHRDTIFGTKTGTALWRKGRGGGKSMTGTRRYPLKTGPKRAPSNSCNKKKEVEIERAGLGENHGPSLGSVTKTVSNLLEAWSA